MPRRKLFPSSKRNVSNSPLRTGLTMNPVSRPEFQSQLKSSRLNSLSNAAQKNTTIFNRPPLQFSSIIFNRKDSVDSPPNLQIKQLRKKSIMYSSNIQRLKKQNYQLELDIKQLQEELLKKQVQQKFLIQKMAEKPILLEELERRLVSLRTEQLEMNLKLKQLQNKPELHSQFRNKIQPRSPFFIN